MPNYHYLNRALNKMGYNFNLKKNPVPIYYVLLINNYCSTHSTNIAIPTGTVHAVGLLHYNTTVVLQYKKILR